MLQLRFASYSINEYVMLCIVTAPPPIPGGVLQSSCLSVCLSVCRSHVLTTTFTRLYRDFSAFTSSSHETHYVFELSAPLCMCVCGVIDECRRLPVHTRVCVLPAAVAQSSDHIALFVYLFKHGRQRAEATYMPVKSVQ